MGGIKYELAYSFEYLTDLVVAAPIVPPPFNHSAIVTVYEEVGVTLALWYECPGKEFKVDGSGQGDVSFAILC